MKFYSSYELMFH